MEFKDRIKELREKRELSPSQLGAAMDKSEGAVRSWEKGQAYSNVATLLRHYTGRHRNICLQNALK